MKIKYILYGMGNVFHEYFSDGKLINRLNELNCVLNGVADSFRSGEKENIAEQLYTILSETEVCSTDVDKIVLCLNDDKVMGSIASRLMRLGVEKDRIIPVKKFLQCIFCAGEYKHKLSIVAIVKEEEKHILEWIEYHRIMGVDHFYIYDNGQSNLLKELLGIYIKNKIVELIDWPGTAMQIRAYDHAIENFRYDSQYMAFIDADEFFACKFGNLYYLVDSVLGIKKEPMSVSHLLPGGLGVNWRVFGTSGFANDSYDLVTSTHFYRCSDFNRLPNAHIKTIANPRTVDKAECHYMHFLPMFGNYSLLGSFIVGPYFPDGIREEKIRVYHYAYRSEREIERKFQRGYALKHVTEEEIKKMTIGAKEENRKFCNEVRDDWMSQYEYELKSRVNGIVHDGVLTT